MHPSERINYIKAIAAALSNEDWALIDLTLKQFELPWSDQWSGQGKEAYIIAMLSDAKNEPLLQLAKHLGVASQLESLTEPAFWSSAAARVFLSHLASMKAPVAQLKQELSRHGISAFVAHDDIEPTREWQDEIESALATMDGLVAVLAPGFTESKWCDQEIGVAIGRGIPIVAVRCGLDPYGFIGKYQAIPGAGRDARALAYDLYEAFMLHPSLGSKITSALVAALAKASSFGESRRLISLIENSAYLTTKHIVLMKESLQTNKQVSSAWGVPERIAALAEQARG